VTAGLFAGEGDGEEAVEHRRRIQYEGEAFAEGGLGADAGFEIIRSEGEQLEVIKRPRG
jgi:hypothetical protein